MKRGYSIGVCWIFVHQILRNQLRDEHAEAWKLNLNSEKIQTVAFDGADKQYTEALNSYDTEMGEKTKEKQEAEADC